MRLKTSFFLLLSFSALLLLASCSSQTAATPTANTVSPPTPTLIPATATSTGAGCTEINTAPTPEASSSNFPAVTATDFTRGPSNAPVTMIEYCDFQTPICLSMAAVASNLVYKHPNDLQFVFRPVPIAALDKSQMAVDAALAADEQGHF
ncbi:MAG: thioredoxin domain-containing protein [Chloroflexi bacterium]|nr:thioredoxin domain-containing protein [Chloroflexota bacterium]